MVDCAKIRDVVCKGIKEYCGLPIIRSGQNAPAPDYPYISYTVTTLMSENNGTYSIKNDKVYKEVTQTWSITIIADNYNTCIEKAMLVRNWLDFNGRMYLTDNDVVVQQITAITTRDNMLTVDYEFRCGFDVIFSCFDEIGDDREYIETIETENDSELPKGSYDFGGISDVEVILKQN